MSFSKSALPLPSVLDRISGDQREKWTQDFFTLLRPLDQTDELKRIVHALVAAPVVLDRVFSDEWTPEVRTKLMPVLHEYISCRGTPRALRLLVQSLTGLSRFKIFERTLPKPHLAIATHRLGADARLFSEGAKRQFVLIQFDHYERELGEIDRKELEKIIQSEVDPSLVCLLDFKKKKLRRKLPQLSQFKIGESL
ncbi:MAG: hypothetical protein EA369_07415 [Bradymonadales bacterium]|nr:MAG: hypothetical protein EA369_07415 [Bradymonadales bacterium]